MNPIFYPEGFSTTLLLLGITTFVFVFYIYQKFFQDEMKKIYSLIPGPEPILFFGNAHLLPNTAHGSFYQINKLMDNYREHGMFLFHAGTEKLLMVNSPELAEIILSKKEHIDKGKQYNYFHQWLGSGLLTSTGEKWKTRRRLLTPAFHFQILRSYIEIFNKHGYKLVSKLSQHEDGASFNVLPYITRCTLDIIHETALGISIGAQDGGNTEYVNAIHRINHVYNTRIMKPWARINFLYHLSGLSSEEKSCIEVLHNKSNAIIDAKLEEFRNAKQMTDNEEIAESPRKLAFLDLLLQEESFSKEDIREEVDTIMFAGHDTLSSALWFCMYALARNPEKQNLVHEELDDVFENSERHVTTEDLSRLKYLDCCIKEAVRLFPPVPFISRNLKENLILDGYLIPNGTTVVICPFSLHRHEKYFVKPTEFWPERFLQEERKYWHPFSYIPFSAGSRNCIGQKFAMLEAKVILTMVLRHFRLTCAVKEQDLPCTGQIILRTSRPIDMQFHLR